MATAGFHFLFVLVALYAARIHVRSHPLAPFFFAFLAFFPDLDYFFGVHRATLHNLFVTCLLPLALLFASFFIAKKNVVLKECLLVAFLVLFSHTFIDLFSGPVELFYPLPSQEYTLDKMQVSISIGGVERQVLSATDIGMLLFTLLLLPVFFLEELMELHELGGRSFRASARAVSKQVRKWLKQP